MAERQPEVLLEVGCEGGSFTVVRARLGGRWEYWVESNEAAARDLLGDDEVPESAPHPRRTSFEEALLDLDAYDWEQLLPVEVAPEWRDRVWRRVRFLAGREMSRWEELCHAEEEPRWAASCGQAELFSEEAPKASPLRQPHRRADQARRGKDAQRGDLFLWLRNEGWFAVGPCERLSLVSDRRVFVDQDGFCRARWKDGVWRVGVAPYQGEDPVISAGKRSPDPDVRTARP